jgi:hypothetical protein
MDAGVSGSHAMLASDSFGLSVIDVTSPSAPTVLGSADLPFHGEHSATVGTRSVITGQLGGFTHLWVVDTSIPGAPAVIGELATTIAAASGFQDVALDPTGSFAVVTLGTAGIWTINLNNPALPTHVGTFDTPGYAENVALDATGTLAFVADRVGGLRVVSLANLNAPAAVGSLAPAGRTYRDVAIAGSLAYLVNQGGSLDVVNVGTPSAPQLVTWTLLNSSAFRVAVSGTLAAVYVTPSATVDALAIVDLTTPTSPVLNGTMSLGPIGNTKGLALRNGYAYVAANVEGLKVYNLASAVPQLTGQHTDDFASAAMASSGALALIVGKDIPSNTVRFKVVNVSTPTAPQLVGELFTTLPWSSTPPAVALNGTKGVVTLGTTGIWVLDLSTPSSPRHVGTYDTPGFAEHVAINPLGSLAFIADRAGGLQIVSLASPSTPTLVGSLVPAGRTYRDVVLAGSLAYLVNQGGSLDVVNVATPSAPTLSAWTNLGAPAFQVAVAGSLAVVYVTPTGTDDALAVLDLSVPTNPVLTKTFITGPIGRTKDLAVSGRQAFLAADVDHLRIFNVDSPTSPVTGPTVGPATGVALSGNLAYVADALATLDIVAW